MSDLGDVTNPLEELAENVGSLKVKEVDTSLPLDRERINWYESRFKMLAEDGVKYAINYYLEKANKEGLNEHTLAHILVTAMNYLQ